MIFLEVTLQSISLLSTLTRSELRNGIYEYVLSNSPSPKEVIAVSSSCRGARAEFLPMYFERVGVDTKFCLAEDFLEIFFTDSKVGPLAACRLRIDIGECNGPQHRHMIDMKWLLGTLMRYPAIHVSFSGHHREEVARDLDKLVKIVREKPAWCHRLKDFHSIQLKGWYVHCYSLRPCWVLELVLRAADTQGWSFSKVNKLLEEVGLRLASTVGRVTSFEMLEVQVYRQLKATAVKSS